MLEPYRVLDLCTNGSLVCGQILADLGAEVTAIEPPDGSPARRISPFKGDTGSPEDSLFWWAYSRGKRSAVADLTHVDGRAFFRKLVAAADLVIESFAPGYLDELGLGYQALSAINSGLIMVSITPFGQTGPKATWAATDLTVLAASGVLAITGDDDRPPVRTIVPQAFLHAGAEAAVAGLIALWARHRDGQGQHIDVSAQTAAMMATQSTILQAGWGHPTVTRMSGGTHMGPRRVPWTYPCKGGYVSVLIAFGSSLGPFFQRLIDWMAEEGFADETLAKQDWSAFYALFAADETAHSVLERCITAIERFTLSHTKAELFEGARARRLLIAPVRSIPDLLTSEQLRERSFWTGVATQQTESCIYPGPFAQLSGTPIVYRRSAPAAGEHTGEIAAAAMQSRHDATAAQPVAPMARNALPPLAGVRVLDFTWVFAGPIATRYLSDWGATVVKVESGTRPDTLRTTGGVASDGGFGPGASSGFANANLGKLSVLLNLSKPGARELALKLVRWADVVVDNYSPRAMKAWGLDYESLKQVNPGIIALSASFSGGSGPDRDFAGVGSMGSALAGFHELTGWPDRPPAGPYMAYTDYVPPKYMMAALLGALEHRRQTGEGQFIDLAQLESSIHFLTPAILDYAVNGRVPERDGNNSADEAPHGVYPCKGDDRWVAIAVRSQDEWVALCRAANHASWLSDARFASFEARQANREALDAVIGAWTGELDGAAIESALQAVHVPVHRVNTSADAFADPQLVHRGHFVDVAHPGLGYVPVEASRFRFLCGPSVNLSPAPMMGEHSHRVLGQFLGLPDDEIARLVAEGVVA